MARTIDLTGRTFGRLTVLKHAYTIRGLGKFYECRCTCGATRFLRACALYRSQSCGCAARELLVARNMSHGATSGDKETPEYRAWRAARERCTKPTHISYPWYGAKGIRFAPEWENNFPAFLAHIGPRPAGATLDRIDPTGHYEPGNVRWATWKEQQRNRGNNRLVTAFGKTQCLAAWAEEIGIGESRIRLRLNRGLSPEDALDVRRRRPGPRARAAGAA